MAGPAVLRSDAVAVGATADIHRMAMPVIALARKIRIGVAIRAARMAKYGANPPKGRRRLRRVRCVRAGRLLLRKC
jgi:hypothetical protein